MNYQYDLNVHKVMNTDIEVSKEFVGPASGGSSPGSELWSLHDESSYSHVICDMRIAECGETAESKEDVTHDGDSSWPSNIQCESPFYGLCSR